LSRRPSKTDEAKREFIFLALLWSHPTLSWIALGFPDGAFFGALRAAGDEIDMVGFNRTPKREFGSSGSTPTRPRRAT
jgi:hypothetical protein